MTNENDQPLEQATFECPACGHEVTARINPHAAMIACSNCGEPLVIPGADGSLEVTDEDADAEQAREIALRHAQAREEELSALHIRQLTHLRRSAYRAIAYCMIGSLITLVAAEESVRLAWASLRIHDWLWTAIELTAVIVLLAATVFMLRRVFRLRREVKKSPLDALEAPHGAPDFTQLSDGSQQVDNLEGL